jgi:hypothetical protein
MAPKEPESSELVMMSRPMSQSEENWARITDMGSGISASVIAMKRNVEEQHITMAVRNLMENYPLTRAHIVENNKGKLYLQVNNGPVNPIVREKSWPNIDSSVDLPGVLQLPDDDENHSLSLALHQVIRSELNFPFLNEDRMAAPPLAVLEVHFYKDSSSGPRTIVVIRVHSGACDRHSCFVIAKHFVSALNAVVEGREPEFPDGPERHELLSPIEDMVPKGKADKGFFSKGRDALGYALDSRKYSLLPFSPEFTKMSIKAGFMSDVILYRLGKEGTGAFFSACGRENTSYSAALASAYFRTAANIKEMKEKKLNQFCFSGMLDCRPYFEPQLPETVLGNYSAGILQGTRVKDDISFWDMARSISSKTESDISKDKHFSELPIVTMLAAQLIKHPSLAPGSSKRSGLFTTYFGEPADPQWKNAESLNVAGSLGPLASMHSVGPCFCACDSMIEGPDGPELCISLTFATPVYSREQMHSFATSILELLSSESSKSR